jgi:hypothetical protein
LFFLYLIKSQSLMDLSNKLPLSLSAIMQRVGVTRNQLREEGGDVLHNLSKKDCGIALPERWQSFALQTVAPPHVIKIKKTSAHCIAKSVFDSRKRVPHAPPRSWIFSIYYVKRKSSGLKARSK